LNISLLLVAVVVELFKVAVVVLVVF